MKQQFDRAALAPILHEGIAALDLNLSVEQSEKLLDYLALLAKWNSVYNLTSVRSDADADLACARFAGGDTCFRRREKRARRRRRWWLAGHGFGDCAARCEGGDDRHGPQENGFFDASEGGIGLGECDGVHETGGTAGSEAKIRRHHLACFCGPVRFRQLVGPSFGRGRSIHRLERGGAARRARATASRVESERITGYPGARAKCRASSGLYSKSLNLKI